LARRHRIKELEQKHDNLESLIVALVNAGGQAAAARELKVTQATISQYLKRNSYRPKTIYIKDKGA
jgi:hypothetical protein